MKTKNILLILIIIIIIFFLSFIFFKSNKNNKKIIKNSLENKNFYFEKNSRGIKKFSIKGDKYYLGNDKQIHVEGNVKFLFYLGDKKIKISSNELTYTFDMKNIFFKKNVIMEIGKIKLYSSELFYADLIVLKSLNEVKVKAESFSFKAKMFYYNFSKKRLVFTHLKDFIIKKDNIIYEVEAKNLFYFSDKNMISLRGSPIVIKTMKKIENHEYSFPFINIFLNKDNSLKEGDTPVLNINIQNNKKNLTRELIINKAKFLWKDGKLNSLVTNKSGTLTQYKDNYKRVFNFKTLKILFNESETLKSITTKNLQMLFYKISKGNEIRIGFGKAELSKIEFYGNGKISNILLTDKNTAFIIDENYKASANIIFNYPEKNLSILIGNSGITFEGETSISAKYLYSNKSKRILIGQDNVKGVIYKENMSFLCDIFNQNKNSFKFKNDVFIKKEEMEIKGKFVDFDKKKHIFIIKDGNITDKDIFIEGDEIIKYKERIEIKTNIVFKKEELKITGEKASVTMTNKKYDIINIDNKVKISYKKGKGKADKTIVILNKKTVEMIGNAQFKREGGMNVEGDKLTLNLHNGKIYAVSNKKKKVKIVLEKENDKSN